MKVSQLMRYVGGKSRQAKAIRDVIDARRGDRTRYVEPFMGGGSTFAAIAPMFDKAIGSDSQPDLMSLWRAVVLDGWVPPATMTREEYAALRHGEPSPMRAWAGFATSYNGKWFAGYGPTAHGGEIDYLGQCQRGILKKAAALDVDRVSLDCCDYAEHEVTADTVVYCDPPYAGTLGYGATVPFDHERFWATAEDWSRRGALVLVSEYSAPAGWKSVHAVTRKATMHHSGNAVVNTEHLYINEH